MKSVSSVSFVLFYQGNIRNLQSIFHGRKSNLVEFQILPEESPVGVSTSRKSNLKGHIHLQECGFPCQYCNIL